MYNYVQLRKNIQRTSAPTWCVYVLSIIKTFDSCVHYCYWGKSLLFFFCFTLISSLFFFHFVFLLINSSIGPRAHAARGKDKKKNDCPLGRKCCETLSRGGAVRRNHVPSHERIERKKCLNFKRSHGCVIAMMPAVRTILSLDPPTVSPNRLLSLPSRPARARRSFEYIVIRGRWYVFRHWSERKWKKKEKKRNRNLQKSEIMHRLGLPEALSVSLLLLIFFFLLIHPPSKGVPLGGGDLNVFREERARRKTRKVGLVASFWFRLMYRSFSSGGAWTTDSARNKGDTERRGSLLRRSNFAAITRCYVLCGGPCV